jgi:hypothetical protein
MRKRRKEHSLFRRKAARISERKQVSFPLKAGWFSTKSRLVFIVNARSNFASCGRYKHIPLLLIIRELNSTINSYNETESQLRYMLPRFHTSTPLLHKPIHVYIQEIFAHAPLLPQVEAICLYNSLRISKSGSSGRYSSYSIFRLLRGRKTSLLIDE